MREHTKQWRKSLLSVGKARIPVYEVNSHAGGHPIIVCLGWLERPETFAQNARCLGIEGKQVIAADTMQSGTIKKKDVEERKEAILETLLDAKKIKRCDIVAHSEGALFALRAVVRQPHRFATVVLVNPAGCIGKDSALRLAFRYIREIFLHSGALWREARGKEPFYPEQFEEGKVHILSGIATFFSYPLETIRSVRAIVKADIRGELEEAHRRGVRVIIIHGVEDRVFPHAAMHEYVGDALLVETGGSHVWYLLEPARYAKLVLQALKQ